MPNVTIRELRHNSSDVVARPARGETITITRSGRPGAELRPIGSSAVSAEMLLARWRRLPIVDPARPRADLDDVVDAFL